MINLITKYQRHLLYKDELGEPFILTKYGEIFETGEDHITVYTWSKWYRDWIVKLVPILHESSTDDPLFIVRCRKADLASILTLQTHKKRPDLNGTWLKEAEIKLCHKIYPYNPERLRGSKDQIEGQLVTFDTSLTK